jgi:hypothetical protein
MLQRWFWGQYKNYILIHENKKVLMTRRLSRSSMKEKGYYQMYVDSMLILTQWDVKFVSSVTSRWTCDFQHFQVSLSVVPLLRKFIIANKLYNYILLSHFCTSASVSAFSFFISFFLSHHHRFSCLIFCEYEV